MDVKLHWGNTSIGILGEPMVAYAARELLSGWANERSIQKHSFTGSVLDEWLPQVEEMLQLGESRLRENPGMETFKSGGDLFFLGNLHYALRRSTVLGDVRRLTRLSKYTGVYIAVEMDVNDLPRWPGLPAWYGMYQRGRTVWNELQMATDRYIVE